MEKKTDIVNEPKQYVAGYAYTFHLYQKTNGLKKPSRVDDELEAIEIQAEIGWGRLWLRNAICILCSNWFLNMLPSGEHSQFAMENHYFHG